MLRITATIALLLTMVSTTGATQDITPEMEAFVRARGFRVVRLLTYAGPYYALVVGQESQRDEDLWFLRVAEDSIRMMHEPLWIPGPFWGYPEIEWFALEGDSIDHVRWTTDLPVESHLYTRLYRLVDGELVLEYSDDRYTCRPAELKDVDGDLVPELIAYIGITLSEDCEYSCQNELRWRFGVPVAWVQSHRWIGDRWVEAVLEYPEFYRSVAQRYQEIVRWLSGSEGKSVCRYSTWLHGGSIFIEWEKRAWRIAEPSVLR